MRSTYYEVFVGNVGKVYSGDNEAQARRDFKHYSIQSLQSIGRVAGEDVTLFEDGEPIKFYAGKRGQSCEKL